MKVSTKPSKAVAEARKLLKEHGTTLPIDVEAVVKRQRIDVRPQPMEESVSGMLVIKDGRATIGVNQSHHPNRQRFTLAHELGHYLLHGKRTRVFVDSSTMFFRDGLAAEGTDKVEIEANAFAAELLMPESVLRDIARHQPVDAFDDRAIQSLAAKFGVSVRALTIRLTKLGMGSL
jgi:Zn-dependent peptidase ImmA (M78 family)